VRRSVDAPLGHTDDRSPELRAALERLPAAVRELYETRGPEALRMFCGLYPQTVTLCETSGLTPPDAERFLAFFEEGAAFPEASTPTGVGLANLIKRVMACLLCQYLGPVFAQLADGAAEDAEGKVRDVVGRFFTAVDGVLAWIPATVTPADAIPRLPRLLGLVLGAMADGAVSDAPDGEFARALSAALELTGIATPPRQDAEVIADRVTGTEAAQTLEERVGHGGTLLLPGVTSVVAACAAEGITAAQACAALPALAGAAIARAAAIRSSRMAPHRRVTAASVRRRIVRRIRVRRGPRPRRHTARGACRSSSALDGEAGGDGSGLPLPRSSSPLRCPARRLDLARAEIGRPCCSGRSGSPCPADLLESTGQPS
jgi:hypothetical protein